MLIMKRFFVCCFVCLLFVSCGRKSDSLSFQAMDTFMTVRSYGRNCRKANRLARKSLLECEDLISTTKENSLIYMLNEEPEKGVKTGVEICGLVDFSIKMAERTYGALNPVLFPVTRAWGFTSGNFRIPDEQEIEELLKLVDYRNIKIEPAEDSAEKAEFRISMKAGMMMDLGAVGKGFAGDRVLKMLSLAGIESAIIDLGGNIQVLGNKPDGSPWTVGVKNPWGGEPVCGIKVSDCAVVTSGGYERFFEGEDGRRYIHIFDGRTGCPVENDLAAVTAVCASGLYADSLSTALFVMGSEKAVSFWRENRDFDFVIIKKDAAVLYTAGLKGKIFFTAGTPAAVCVE